MLKQIRIGATSILFFVLLLSSTGPLAATFNTKNEQAHGAWYSLYLYLGDDRQGRAVNTKRNGETLALDIPVGDCTSYIAQLQITFDSSADETTTGKAYGVRARIDTNPVHELDATIRLQRGERTAYIPFIASNSARFWREIRNGQTIRFEMTMKDGDKVYTSFSLDGSAAATARAKSICEQRSPSSYFDDDERKGDPKEQRDKPDSSYF